MRGLERKLEQYSHLNEETGMKKKYKVFASEIVHYMIEVEAESEEQAIQLGWEHEWDYGDAIDGHQFQIEQAQEEK